MNTGDQVRVFLAMMLCGVCTAAVYDLLSVLRRGYLLTAIADILLGLFLAAGMIGVGLQMACDSFRLFSFAGVGTGWMIYMLTLGTIVRTLTRLVVKLSKKVVN